MNTEPALMSLTSVAQAIAAKRLSSREATQSCLDRTAQWQPRLNAFMAIEAEAALAAADAADAALAKGNSRGALQFGQHLAPGRVAIGAVAVGPGLTEDAGPPGAGMTVLRIEGDGLKFAASSLAPRAQPARRIIPGALIRLARAGKDSWTIAQIPQVESAFVACDARDGAVRAFVGGFDFNLNKFDHVTQAWRQPGSSIKPFIYAAALEKGLMTSTLVNDSPLMLDPDQTGGQVWDPKNFEGTYEGPMRLRQGLAKSKNMVSIRVLQQIGPPYAQQFLGRFGFDPERHPAYLTMALGAGAVTPWQELSAYTVFANGGFGTTPYLIARVADASGKVLMEAGPRIAGDSAPRVLDAGTAFIMDSMLRDVARYGTGARASSLGRSDVAGKTGTTNDSHDAWFSGYGGGIVGVAWIGFDQPRPLGERETGGGLALPIWLDYMGSVLKGVPTVDREPPSNVVTVDGEYYLEQFQPGQGIASLGLDEALTPEQARRNENVF